MIAALTLFIVLTLSVLVIRTGAVALRLTGLPDEAARFQARSAFTGTGFTTSESEAIVNHPVRRRIASLLMTIGSLGFVSVLATVVVSLVGSSGSTADMMRQLLWLGGVLLALWFLVLNPVTDRVMCDIIGRLLAKTEGFGGRRPARLLQLPAGHVVMQVLVHPESGLAGRQLGELVADGVVVLGLQREDGAFVNLPGDSEDVRLADEIFCHGPDEILSRLGAGRGQIETN
ncbi:MAG: potassium transporter TrkA [Alphaproteobacteria bacterium]|nr:potassium transporter TrkA [Alphaproteobacteria bacterium]